MSLIRFFLPVIGGAALAVAVAGAAQQTGGIYRIELFAIDTGGGSATGSVYWHCGAVGQSAGAGTLTSGVYQAKAGVMPVPVPEAGAVLGSLIALAYARRGNSA